MPLEPTNIDTLQHELQQRTLRETRRGVLSRLLIEFGPQSGDLQLDYRAMLQQAYTVLGVALAEEDTKSGAASGQTDLA